jgi:hypothetical protein
MTRIRNIILISILFVGSFLLMMTCTGLDKGYWLGCEYNDCGAPFEKSYQSIDQMIANGMLEGEEKEAMINAKIEHLEKLNKVFWGKLPNQILEDAEGTEKYQKYAGYYNDFNPPFNTYTEKEMLLKGFNSLWMWIRTSFPGFKDIYNNLSDYKLTDEEGKYKNWDDFGRRAYEILEKTDSYGDFLTLLTHMGIQLKEGHVSIRTNRVYGENWQVPYVDNAPVFKTSTSPLIGACYSVTDEVDEDGDIVDHKMVITHIAEGPNPYGLERGDEFLGYNGVPWQEWYPALLGADLPVLGSPAASDGAIWYSHMRAGMTNPNLFEVINIKKKSGEIKSYPVELFPDFWQDYNPCLEVLRPIPGVPTPDEEHVIGFVFDRDKTLKSGIVKGEDLVFFDPELEEKLKGKRIGYMYITQCPSGFDDMGQYERWDPYKTQWSRKFAGAIEGMLDTDGLIIDIRFNMGGRNETFYAGLAKLINADEDIDIFDMLGRDPKDPDILGLEPVGLAEKPLRADDKVYGKPIVVLTGPDCISAGDFLTAFFSRFPEFTIIGKDNNGSFCGVSGDYYDLAQYEYIMRYIPMQAGIFYEHSKAGAYDKILIRRSDFLHEKVWHTKENILKSVDTTQKRAFEIIVDGGIEKKDTSGLEGYRHYQNIEAEDVDDTEENTTDGNEGDGENTTDGNETNGE